MLKYFANKQHSRTTKLWAVLADKILGLAMASSVGLAAVTTIGCSSTSPFASPGNRLAQNRNQQVAPRAIQTAQQPTHSQPTPSPTVSTVSYVEPADTAMVGNVPSNGAGPAVQAQLAGLRRATPQCASGQGCTACQSNQCGGESATCGECQVCQAGQRGYDAQEYICDGGDLDPAAIVRKDWNAVGVDTTDTVMYYETLAGKVCITPSNRTCIYAPRFGSVRQVTGAMIADRAQSTGRVFTPVPAHGLADLNRAGDVEQSTKIIGQRQVQVLDRLMDQRRGVGVDTVVPPTPVGAKVAAQVRGDRSMADVALSREWAALIEDRIEVITWISPEAIQVQMDNQVAVAVSDIKSASEFYLYETPDGCTMRLTKTASHQFASPGDRIRFTIRFENVGTQKLGNAVILDSLSPRLNYIEGSQQCSLEARFSIEPNDAGSSVLRWDIQSPIDSQQTGVVSFDCEVR